jgi:rhomboid protease GluP
MAARVCPYCRELNGAAEKRCYRCGRRLPGPLLQGVLKTYREVLGVEAPMTRLIIGLELLAFTLALLVNGGMPPLTGFLAGEGRFSGSTLLRFGALAGRLGAEEPFRMLSAVFVHMSLLHVGMNMLTHLSFARQLEHTLGAARLCVLFVLSGFLGFLVSEVWYGWSGPPTAGASGAVFGEIGAIVGILYARRDPMWKKALARNVVLALILAILLPVNTAAHFGGFFAGILIGFGLSKEIVTLRLHRTMAVLAALSLVASVASVVLSAMSPHVEKQLQYERERQ